MKRPNHHGRPSLLLRSIMKRLGLEYEEARKMERAMLSVAQYHRHQRYKNRIGNKRTR